MKTRTLIPFLAIALGLTACSAPESTNAAPAAETITITDHTGNEVEIPTDIERVAVDEIPIASTYLAYHDGKAPYMVGMSQSVVTALEDTVVADMAPELLDVETGYYADGELNVESLLDLDPDVVFYNARNTEHGEQFAAAGIPAVGFATEGDPAVVYADWLELLEEVFQEPGKMDDKIAYGAELIDDAQTRAAQVADADRRNAMIIFNYSDGTMRVAGEPPFFGYYWLQTANADNAAVGADQPLTPVNAEQVFEWDPDFVLVGGAGQANLTVDEVIDGTADGLDLSGLRAAQEGNVFSNELGMWSWFTPNPDAPVIANWIGSTIYPEQFEDVDLPQIVQDYYQEVYDYELTDSQAEEILRGSDSQS
ncbi:MAG: ABC transporter substrate-binding protein [Corynebacterium casei]|uniref:ABC transporter substrate-binding protein n=1 Tax=Corynebacterium casei TaxID=160386 RepID=UPI002647E4C4|nr:ABC transporter substrate-binding protein [Corynebacterium casei]MDN5903389.1 ABC transporter substrate-binding protein [Corynebacterium casei]MDN6627572.1 ABC transporter substrate-binding protein [Corynebacterium casei]MDN6674688.1 ABC transporter substrate-binding protein [Corynebacterium casei]MDN6694426.1 ABC transporter substrate-binding protein [Corynebacterium casei]